MVLTKEDAFEAEPVDMLPVGDARVEDRRGYLWRDIFTGATRRIEEFKDPRLDHAFPHGLRPAVAAALIFGDHLLRSALSRCVGVPTTTWRRPAEHCNGRCHARQRSGLDGSE